MHVRKLKLKRFLIRQTNSLSRSWQSLLRLSLYDERLGMGPARQFWPGWVPFFPGGGGCLNFSPLLLSVSLGQVTWGGAGRKHAVIITKTKSRSWCQIVNKQNWYICDAWKGVKLFQIRLLGLSERRIKQEDVISNCFISRKNDGKSSTDGNQHRQYFSCAPGGSHPSRIAQKLIFHKDLNRHLFLINLLVYFQRNSMNLNSNRRFLSGTNS